MEKGKDGGIQLCLQEPSNGGSRAEKLLREGLSLLVYGAVIQMIWQGLGVNGICSPWSAILTGIVLAAIHVGLILGKKENLFYPIVLAALLVTVLAAGKYVWEGLALMWNCISNVYTGNTAKLLAQLQTNLGENLRGVCLGLSGAVSGSILYLLCLQLTERLRAVTAVLLAAGGLLVLIVFRQPVFPGWLIPVLGTSCVLLLSSTGRNNRHDRHWSLLAGVMTCLVVFGIFYGITGISQVKRWMNDVQKQTESTLHDLRFETAHTALPEGQFENFDPEQEEEYTALLVTMDKPESMYLRGFVADSFQQEQWLPLSAQQLAEHKQMLYWLYEGAFYPQAQYAAAGASLNTEYNNIMVEAVNACTKYAYTPYSLVGGSCLSYLKNGSLRADTVYADADHTVGYRTIYAADSMLDTVLEQISHTDDPAVLNYRRAESSYRDFVRAADLQIPESVIQQMGQAMDECCSSYGPANQLTLAQAQSSALLFLSRYFGEKAEKLPMPLESLTGSYYQYATVTAMVLRYYGIPARYVEGYVITPEMAEKAQRNVPITVDNSCAQAWVEVYQQGIGWLPLSLTPGFEALAGEKTEAGIQPVGVAGTNPDSQMGSEEGDGEGSVLTEGQEHQDQDAEKNDTDDLLSKGGTMVTIGKIVRWSMVIWPVLIAAVLAVVIIRKLRADAVRKKHFRDEDPKEAVGWMFAEAAWLLQELGLSRRNGSMEPVCQQAGQQFGEEFGQKCFEMMNVNNLALFSQHSLEETQYSRMYAFYQDVVNLVRKNVKWYRRVWVKWVLCRY